MTDLAPDVNAFFDSLPSRAPATKGAPDPSTNPFMPRPQSLTQRIVNVGPDLSNVVPRSITEFLGAGNTGAPRVIQSLPDYVTQLNNKWSDPDLSAAIAQLSDVDRKALMKVDSDRVSQGSAPLSKQQTINAAQTLQTGKPATAAPEPSPWAVHTNAVRNIGDIVKSIPQLPAALIKEVTQIGHISKTYDNALANLLSSPGIRMIPGAYIGSQVARGSKGLKELASNPVFTLLDALPAASELAKLSPAVEKAAEIAAADGRKIRPLGVLATSKLDEGGNLTRNAFGQSLDVIRGETKIGQAFDSAFGKMNRDVMREQNKSQMRVSAEATGLVNVNDPMAQLTTRSTNLIKKAKEYGWDEAKMNDLASRAVSGDRSLLSDLGAHELAYINEARDLASQYGHMNVNEGQLAQFIDPKTGNAEFYPPNQVKKFTTAKQTAEHLTRMADLRSRYLSAPEELAARPLTAEELAQMHTTATAMGGKRGTAELGAIHSLLEAYGHNSDQFIQAAKTGTSYADTLAQSTPRELLALNDLLRVTDTFRTTGGQPDLIVRDLSRALASRDVPAIRKALDQLKSRTSKASPLTGDPRLLDTVESLRRRYRNDAKLGSEYSVKAAERATKQFESRLARTPPARFDDALKATTDTRVADKITGELAVGRHVTPADAERVVAAVQNADWNALESLGVDSAHLRSLYNGIEKDVRGSWQTLSDQGIDPVFLHRVSGSRAAQLNHPTVGPVPQSLSQVKARATDMSVGVQDLGVALSHQGLEMLQRRASEDFIDFIANKYGQKQSDLMATYRGQAQDLATTNPVFNARAHMQKLVDRGWTRFNPDEAGYSWGGARLDKYRGEDATYIPRSLAHNLKAMNNPASPFTALLNKVTNTFRLSVVGLSPRTQLYNILGGATMLMGETGPAAFKYWGRAREMLKNPALIEDEALRAMVGSSKREILADGILSHPQIQAQVLAGKTLGRMWNDVQAARPGGKVKDLFGKVIDKSLDLNAFFDDTYRVMGYLHGYDKSLTKGMTTEVAQRAGLELANKVMMDWTSLTPFERQTMKAVIPFYGFMNHIVRYAVRYPVDHPLRASIMGSFARAEVEDLGTLPHSFLSSFFFGDTGPTGDRKALSLAGMNPFGDVANMMTFAGFLSATNPMIQTVLEQVGVARGEAELYPSLRYNPETGRLSAARGNPLMRMIENTIPQTTILTSLLGVNGDFRDRMAKDPTSAAHYLQSAAGLPIFTHMLPMVKDVNVSGEIAKAEVNRMKSQSAVKSSALSTGNWTEALRYPGLRDDYSNLLNASPQELAQYTPQGADIYAAMIEQAYGRQAKQAQINAGVQAP